MTRTLTPLGLVRNGTGMNGLMNLHNEIDRVFENMFNSFGLGSTDVAAPAQSFISPRIDVWEDADGYTLAADLPGIDENKLDITLKDNVLTIKAEQQTTKETKDDERHYHRLERTAASYTRSLTLPDDIDADNVKASYTNGVLEVKVGKKEEATPAVKKIALSSASDQKKAH